MRGPLTLHRERRDRKAAERQAKHDAEWAETMRRHQEILEADRLYRWKKAERQQAAKDREAERRRRAGLPPIQPAPKAQSTGRTITITRGPIVIRRGGGASLGQRFFGC